MIVLCAGWLPLNSFGVYVLGIIWWPVPVLHNSVLCMTVLILRLRGFSGVIEFVAPFLRIYITFFYFESSWFNLYHSSSVQNQKLMLLPWMAWGVNRMCRWLRGGSVWLCHLRFEKLALAQWVLAFCNYKKKTRTWRVRMGGRNFSCQWMCLFGQGNALHFSWRCRQTDSQQLFFVPVSIWLWFKHYSW